MVVFGLLGVVFLSVGLVMGYFALREPALVPSFGTIALVFVPMGALFLGMTLWWAAPSVRTQRIRAEGVPGVARIVDITDTGVLDRPGRPAEARRGLG